MLKTIAMLTNEQVVYIRENPDHLNIYELGDKFNVCKRTIGDIQRGKHGCGSHALAKKFGVHPSTIIDIVKSQPIKTSGEP